MKRLIMTGLCAAFFLLTGNAIACTSAIISGKVTPDGRPILKRFFIKG